MIATLIAALLLAQTIAPMPTPPPTLTDVQKLQLQNVAQRIELAQLRAQLADRDFNAARDEIQRLVTALQVEGYTLDLQSLSYVAKPTPPPPPGPPKQ